jgi:hypothetical protein
VRCLTESTVSAHDVEAEKTVWVANSLDTKQSKKFRRETPGGCGGLLAGCRPSVLGSGQPQAGGGVCWHGAWVCVWCRSRSLCALCAGWVVLGILHELAYTASSSLKSSECCLDPTPSTSPLSSSSSSSCI